MTDILQLHRCVQPLDYPARHVVIGSGAIASHRARQSLGTGAKRVVSALTGAIAIASDALNSPFGFGVYVGFVGGCLFTVAAAFLWGMFL